MLYNWQNEAARFTPELKVAVVDGTPAEWEVLIKQANKLDVLVTSYATLQKDEARYKKAGLTFDYVVLDEAQFIKNHSTKNAQIVKKIKADLRKKVQCFMLRRTKNEGAERTPS